MKTLVAILLICFVGLYSCWSPGDKCCPETDLGVILCENSTARSKPSCGPTQECCLRLDMAYTCCDLATQYCNPTAGGCLPRAEAPQDLIPIRLGVFSESLALAIARTRYLWSQEGLNVTYIMVRGSVNQFQMLKNKEVDFISTGIDNSINYAINQINPVGNTQIKTVSVIATDLGSNHCIVVRPNITTADDLKNTIVAVDAAASGFAYIVYDILASVGLVYGQDYHVREIGGGTQRLEALFNGQASAVLLSGENLLQAQAAGFRILRSYSDIKNPIQISSAISIPTDYLAANETIVRKFLRAYYVATQYLTNPANRDSVIALITAANISINPAAFYELQTSPIYGVRADGIIRPQGIYDVVASRNRYGGFIQGSLTNKQICDLIKERNIHNSLFDTKNLKKAVQSLGYTFNNQGDLNCKQLGLNIEDDSNSAFTFVMPITLVFAVVLSVLLF